LDDGQELFQAAASGGANAADGHAESRGDRGVVGGVGREEFMEEGFAGISKFLEGIANELLALKAFEFFAGKGSRFDRWGMGAGGGFAGGPEGLSRRNGYQPLGKCTGIPEIGEFTEENGEDFLKDVIAGFGGEAVAARDGIDQGGVLGDESTPGDGVAGDAGVDESLLRAGLLLLGCVHGGLGEDTCLRSRRCEMYGRTG
jgi:hypothetical protein